MLGVTSNIVAFGNINLFRVRHDVIIWVATLGEQSATNGKDGRREGSGDNTSWGALGSASAPMC